VCVRVRVCVCILRVRVCLFVCLSVCLSVVFVLFVLFVLFVFVSFFLCLLVWLLSVYLSICLSVCLPFYLFVWIVCLFGCLFVCWLVGWFVGLLVCETRYVSCGKEPFKNNFWNHSKSQQGVVAGSRAYHQRSPPGFPGDAWLDQPCVPARLLWSPVTNLMLFQVFVRFECKPLLGSYITARVDSSVTFRRQLFEHSKGPLQSKLLTVSSVCGCVCVCVCVHVPVW
jgi:energy-coupling factor transporter transmembrane protein EcfT